MRTLSLENWGFVGLDIGLSGLCLVEKIISVVYAFILDQARLETKQQ